MNLTCANCGSKLNYSAGKINISVQPCKKCSSSTNWEDYPEKMATAKASIEAMTGGEDD